MLLIVKIEEWERNEEAKEKQLQEKPQADPTEEPEVVPMTEEEVDN